ncbi:right-handed parallel beta-helix repeat-containing protein [Kitasatospora gansuensis]
MYLRRLVLPAAVATVLAATALPAVAAEDVTVLHVDRRSKQCSDAGSGSAAAPFCTVQAGADAARAGQTVLVHEGGYQEQVTVRQSGEPGRPIVIQATGWDQPTWPDVEISTYGNEQRPRGFVLSGVHDVTVRGFRFWTSSEAVLVENSQRVTVERNQADNSGRLGPTPAIRLAGATTGAVVRRNHVLYNESHGIAVDAGVTGAVVSTNVIVANRGGGVVATDAPDTVITSNTLIGNCAGGVALVGGSPARPSGTTSSRTPTTARPTCNCGCPRGRCPAPRWTTTWSTR